jgi:hypothetical protein
MKHGTLPDAKGLHLIAVFTGKPIIGAEVPALTRRAVSRRDSDFDFEERRTRDVQAMPGAEIWFVSRD